MNRAEPFQTRAGCRHCGFPVELQYGAIRDQVAALAVIEPEVHNIATEITHNIATEVTKTTARTFRSRPPDELFDAVVEVCGIEPAKLTSSGRPPINRALKDLRAVGATPAEVRERAPRWPFDVPLTPSGLAKHWASLGFDHRRGRLTNTERLMRRAAELRKEGR